MVSGVLRIRLPRTNVGTSASDGAFVAIKVARQKDIWDATLAAAAASEAHLASAVNHPHLVRALGRCVVPVDALNRVAGGTTAGGAPAWTRSADGLVLEYMAHPLPAVLACRLEDEDELADRDLVTLVKLMWMAQAAQGLAQLHAVNIVHRDVKPSNMLLDEMGQQLKISDFGISIGRSAGEGTLDHASDGKYEIHATKEYANPAVLILGGHERALMSASVCLVADSVLETAVTASDHSTAASGAGATPESPQLRPVSRANDCFSFTCTVLEVLTGLLPWSGVDLAKPKTFSTLGPCRSPAGRTYTVISPVSCTAKNRLSRVLKYKAYCSDATVENVVTTLLGLLSCPAGGSGDAMTTAARVLQDAVWDGFHNRPAPDGGGRGAAGGGTETIAGGAGDGAGVGTFPPELLAAAQRIVACVPITPPLDASAASASVASSGPSLGMTVVGTRASGSGGSTSAAVGLSSLEYLTGHQPGGSAPT